MKYNSVLISYFFKRESTKYNFRQLDRGRVQKTGTP